MKTPKRNKFGNYTYKGRVIMNVGYNRITGHVEWYVSDEKSGKMLFSTDTLRDAIKRINKEGGAE